MARKSRERFLYLRISPRPLSVENACGSAADTKRCATQSSVNYIESAFRLTDTHLFRIQAVEQKALVKIRIIESLAREFQV